MLSQKYILLSVVMALVGCGGGEGGSSSAAPNVGSSSLAESPPLFVDQDVFLPTLSGPSFLYVTEAIDIDYDGYLDVVLGGARWRDGVGFVNKEVTLYVYRNTGDFDFDIEELPGTFVHPRSALQDDFNGDGLPDLVVADTGFDGPPLPRHPDTIFLTDEAGKLVNFSEGPLSNYGYSHDITSGDIDNDGDIDIIVANITADSRDQQFRLLLNDGSGTFSLKFIDYSLPEESYITGLALADLNADGNLDLIAGPGTPGWTLSVFWGLGDAEFSQPEPLPDVPDYAIIPKIRPYDINSDGYMDLVISRTDYGSPGYQKRYIQILLNNGAGQFEEANLIPNQKFNDKWVTDMYFVDLDNDGQRDLILRSDNSKPKQNVLLQQQDGTFDSIELPRAGNPFPIDVDNDGDYDLLIHNDRSESSKFYLLENTTN